MSIPLPTGGTNAFCAPQEIGDIAAFLTAGYAANDIEPMEIEANFRIRDNMPLPVVCVHIVTDTIVVGVDVKEFLAYHDEDPVNLQNLVNALIAPPSGTLVNFIVAYGTWYVGNRVAIIHGALVYRRYSP